MIDAIAAAVLLAVGVVMTQVALPGRLLPWLFAIAVAFLLLALLYQVEIDQKAIGFVYVTIVLTALGPTIMNWAAFVAVSLVGLAGVLLVVTNWEPGHPAEWMIVSLAAVLVSSVLLRARLRSIDDLADASELARRLAVTDELTGLLNRHGLQAQIPRLVAMSGRLDNTMFAIFVDIDGLKLANDRHGHAFGDEVIEAAGHAVLASVRGGRPGRAVRRRRDRRGGHRPPSRSGGILPSPRRARDGQRHRPRESGPGTSAPGSPKATPPRSRQTISSTGPMPTCTVGGGPASKEAP